MCENYKTSMNFRSKKAKKPLVKYISLLKVFLLQLEKL